jgi:hypothetical protein
MWLCGLVRSKQYVKSEDDLPEPVRSSDRTGNKASAGKNKHEDLESAGVPSASAFPGLSLPEPACPGGDRQDDRRSSRVSQPNGEANWKAADRAPGAEVQDAGVEVLRAVLNQLCYPVTLVDVNSVVVLQNDASRFVT